MFDVRTEPWIPVLDLHGSPHEVGIVEALRRAHEWLRLAPSTPLEYVALIRLLVAIVHRGLDGPKTLEEAQVMYATGKIPEAVIEYVESEAGVWDLFDEERPWFQARSAERDASGVSPVARLFPWEPSGNNPVFWEHVFDSALTNVGPAMAARGLLVTHAYSLAGTAGGGRGSFRDGVVAAALTCTAEGRNLAETLVLNCVRYVNDEPMPRMREDAPTWERTERQPDRHGTVPDGYVDFLTLSTRRVLLARTDDGVSGCFYAPGLWPAERGGACDPFVPYRKTKDGRLAPLRAVVERALWRDLHAITAGLVDEDLRESSGVLRFASSVTGAAVNLRAVGVVRSKAKIDTVIEAELRIPIALATSSGHRLLVESCLQLADDCERSLREALRTAVAELVSGTDVEQIAGRLLRTASLWPRLELAFAQLVDEVAELAADDLGDEPEPMKVWREVLIREARRAYEDAVASLGEAGRTLAAAARGRTRLERLLAKRIRAPERSEVTT